MEDLVLLQADDMEENILKIINFVKQVEREHGLKEDEIKYKYTYMHNKNLTQLVINTIKTLFGTEIIIGEDYAHYSPNKGKTWTSHSFIKYINREQRRSSFFDIFGKKTFGESQDFMVKLYNLDIDIDLIHGIRDDFCETEEYKNISYVIDECMGHIVTDGTTDNP